MRHSFCPTHFVVVHSDTNLLPCPTVIISSARCCNVINFRRHFFFPLEPQRVPNERGTTACTNLKCFSSSRGITTKGGACCCRSQKQNFISSVGYCPACPT